MLHLRQREYVRRKKLPGNAVLTLRKWEEYVISSHV